MRTKSLGDRARESRQKLGVTGLELVRELNDQGMDVSHSWLRNVEAGAHSGRPALKLLQLSEMLGVSLRWLITGRGRRDR